MDKPEQASRWTDRPEARQAANDLAQMTIGSWQTMAPRLGLVLRVRYPALIGPSIEPDLLLAVMIDAGSSLVPVTQGLIDRWGQARSTVIEVATNNVARRPVECRTVPIHLGASSDRCTMARAITGGPFTTGLLADRDSVEKVLARHNTDTDLLAMALGDRVLLVTWRVREPKPEGLVGLADLLESLAATLARRMSIRPQGPLKAIVQCRSDGQMAIFRTGGDE